jgi:ribose/xylose/arabinose/galactoside ABC-type transport system permease subunit
LAGSVVPTIIAFGFSVIFIGNVTDLSPGSIVILTSTVTGLLGNAFGIPVMVIGGVLTGVVCMTLNYSIYRITKIPPWIAGLGMTMVYEAIAVSYAAWCASQGQKVVVMNNDIRFLGQQPGIYICWVLAIAAAYVLFNHTSVGINYRATGDNEDVAKIMGIHVDKAMMIGGIMAGAFFGFAGVVKESYAAFVNAQSGLTTLSTVFQPMAATLLAMALANYLNLIIAIPISTFLITLIFNVLTIFGIPSGTFQDTLLGIIVICFAILAQRKVKGVVK